MKITEIKISPRMLLVIFIIFSLFLTLSFVSNYISQRSAMLELMNQFSQNYTATITQSIRNSITGIRLIRHYNIQTIVSSLKFLDIVESSGKLTSENFQSVLSKVNLREAVILDEHMQPVISVPEMPDYDNVLHCLTDSNFYKPKGIEIGLHEIAHAPYRLFSYAIRRKNGGFIIGSVNNRRIETIENIYGFKQYLDNIDNKGVVRY